MLCLLLHCPTGHLSAAACGMARGLLPVQRRPTLTELRTYYRQTLAKRRYGQINVIRYAQTNGTPGSGPWLMCLGRGRGGPVIDTALAQFGRLSGGAATVLVGPAFRPHGSVDGYGGLPMPAHPHHRPSLAALLWATRAAANLHLDRLADITGAMAARACHTELASRAMALPVFAAGSMTREVGLPVNGLALGEASGTHSAQDAPDRAIYHCFGAAHSSVVAAAFHTGLLPAEGPVSGRQIRQIPAFDSRSGSDIGRAVYVGQDERGCPVFVVGFNGARGILTQAYTDLLELVSPRPRMVLTDTLDAVNLLVRIGGYLSRRLRLVSIGRPMTALGIVWSIKPLRTIVRSARQELEPSP